MEFKAILLRKQGLGLNRLLNLNSRQRLTLPSKRKASLEIFLKTFFEKSLHGRVGRQLKGQECMFCIGRLHVQSPACMPELHQSPL